MEKYKKSCKDLSFHEAVRILEMIRSKKITLSQLKELTTKETISMLEKYPIEWIKTAGDKNPVIITETGMQIVTEYLAMVVLKDMIASKSNKYKMDINTPEFVSRFLEKKEFIKNEGEFVCITDTGLKAVTGYFNEE